MTLEFENVFFRVTFAIAGKNTQTMKLFLVLTYASYSEHDETV